MSARIFQPVGPRPLPPKSTNLLFGGGGGSSGGLIRPGESSFGSLGSLSEDGALC